MNKHELIEKIGSLDKLYGEKYYVALDDVLDLVKQLDELEKVVVPQFVAGWIEEARKSCKDVADLFDFDFTNEEVGKWFMQERPFDLAARAWLDGYEVEKEKRYTVVMKGTKQPLFYNNLHERLFFSLGELATRFTRKQIEDAGLGEVFNSPLFEVEEVEE